MRKLALLLVICLAVSMMPVSVLADESLDIVAEDAFEEAEGATGAEGLTAGDGEDTLSDALISDNEMPEFTFGESEDSQTSGQIDYARDLSYSPAFLVGYAQALPENAGLLELDGQPLPEGTVVYAHDRSLEDNLKVAYDTPEGVVVGWMRATELRPLDAAEMAAFTAAALAREGVRCFDAEGTLPLDIVGAAAQPEAQENPESEETPEPVVTAVPEPTATATPDPTAAPAPTATPAPTSTPAPVVTPAPTATPQAQVMAPQATQGIHTDPNGPQLKRSEITLGEQETFALEGMLPAGVQGTIAYSSANAGIAAVAQDGTVTAIAVGDVLIKATATGGAYSECLVHVKKQPDKVSFSQASYVVGKGESSDRVKIIVGSAEGQFAGGYTITSKNKKIVTVDANGVVKGKKKGTTTLTVRTYNGKTATCKVQVKKAPSKITLYADKKTMGVNETGMLTYKLTKKSAGRVTFVSEQPNIVSVNADTGEMRALAIGTARLRATTFNGKKGYVTVTVKAAPKTLSVAPQQLVLGVGMKLNLTPTLDSGAAGAVSYTSGNASIASVSGSAVQGVQPGETVIRARTYNGLTAECKVIVKPAPAKVSLPYKTLYLGVGESLRLQPDVGDSASTFTYKSSNKKIVKVSADGVVTAKKKGTIKVTIKTYNKKSYKLKIVVRKAPKAISVSPASAEMIVGETLRLGCAITKKSAGAITYSSANPAIARVDAQTGLVTAVGSGKVEITARTYNGKTAKSTISVYPVPTWVKANTSFVQLGVGQTYKLSATITPGSRSAIGYASANGGIAAVDKNGVITGKAVGQTTITLSTNAPGVTDTVSVTVVPAPSQVKLDKTALTVNVEETFRLKPTIPEGSMTSFTYSSSDSKVATISGDGAVVAVTRGTVTLTVTTHNGKQASMKLTVLDPWYPDSARLTNIPEQLKIGDTYQMEYAASPADARPALQWSSSNTGVAAVDGQGRIKAVASGYATIKAQSLKNSAIKLEFVLAVQMEGIAMVIPARTTDVAGISRNLTKIDAIRATAIAQIDALEKGGVIKAADASKRRSIVNNIFKDYAFPWMTPALQKYWKKANSEGGAKDFKPGIVYYGMPYISGSGYNRRYNAAKAISEKRYTDSGKGYYVLNQKKYLNSKYVGNDCSGLVDQAIWGTSSSHSGDRTSEIATSSAYKTIKDAKAMRPGDLLCKAYSHVVMFLYYTNPEKTQMMIIENGGSEAGTNTVHCSVMNVSSYTKKSYKIRRLKSLG